MTDRMSLKRTVDPIFLFSEFLRWVGYLRNLYWILKQLGRVAGSRSLLLLSMGIVTWLVDVVWSLRCRRLPPQHGLEAHLPLFAIEGRFFDFMDGLYLHLALKYAPATWYRYTSWVTGQFGGEEPTSD